MSQNRKLLPLALFSGLLVLALFLVLSRPQGSSPATVQPGVSFPNQASSWETKSNSEGAVTVEVTPLVLNTGGSPKFKVTFTTHSVELDFNVEDIVDLTDDKGKTAESPKWIGSPPGGHHRSGELAFGGNLGVAVKSVTLTFKNIAGVPSRVFTWNLP